MVGEKFSCSFVYGASDKKGREDLFNQLEGLKLHIIGPWLIMEDFNCIANINERIGQRPRNHEMVPLRRCMEVCEIRDRKGLYRLAREGKLKHFTGISSPYEPPEQPELTLDTSGESLEGCIERILTLIERA